MEKRGQELSITTLLLIVLGIVVVVIIILGFTVGWNTIFDKFKFAPSDMQSLTSACEVYVQGGLKVDYCTFREVTVDDKSQWANCEDPRISNLIDTKGETKPSCVVAQVDDKTKSDNGESTKCLALFNALGTSPDANKKKPVCETLINTKMCKDFIFTQCA